MKPLPIRLNAVKLTPKPERLTKHNKSENHQTAMAKWIDSRANKKRNTSILSKLQESHKQDVKENRDYLKVIIECLMLTALQNIAQLWKQGFAFTNERTDGDNS